MTLLKHWKAALIILICSGCGASHHLKKSEKHLAIAIAKGATVEQNTDTIYVDQVIEVPVIMADTVVKLTTDTIRVTKNGIETKILIRDKKVYIKQVVHAPPITVRRTIVVNHSKTIKAGKSIWELIQAFIMGVVIGGAGVYLFGFFRDRRK
jgi:hypothetical protein